MGARSEALRALIRDRRKAAGLTQAQLAKRLGRYQSYVAMIEGGELRVDLLEFLEIAKATGFDPALAIRELTKTSET
ncbi:MAG: helix-turn-helix transcriptional regulator [Bradyrhizobium sp.]|uniref:Helix-turn-helix transcriptional regulator n=1 Tax=Bradyrhizobium denitrificans TaxID=2734912 RepID=A0ABS5GGB4_9BRAD|nr:MULTISPECIES: helix-turn-helix transcriptional regulator [Bradyrhizobium]MBR1140355.1 helix-turn-helix transcriptional regulator [Bradyrhizobium denitrificans]MDU0956538.1 helix-turn-helix transcriptional regulator [Bradyrhizobium sp.]MDU1496684.1 helix-turn-helix transcriptional regulator [Bradyrhizobium sp.]MDU1548113.1 helix-turn-helix transcriptional regulator [Bradyrhizobium sp.]MDU1695409.1 helix-turn-helix transcriptional regulator [Bradyrhizobium sp.]